MDYKVQVIMDYNAWTKFKKVGKNHAHGQGCTTKYLILFFVVAKAVRYLYITLLDVCSFVHNFFINDVT